jgi:hypothetical protein
VATAVLSGVDGEAVAPRLELEALGIPVAAFAVEGPAAGQPAVVVAPPTQDAESAHQQLRTPLPLAEEHRRRREAVGIGAQPEEVLDPEPAARQVAATYQPQVWIAIHRPVCGQPLPGGTETADTGDEQPAVAVGLQTAGLELIDLSDGRPIATLATRQRRLVDGSVGGGRSKGTGRISRQERQDGGDGGPAAEVGDRAPC